mmetsp:Transcript_43062/g.84205  ORF Transcript_43062/g.84205 Transcript_43062/m.84205 type:complete len:476 (-) Transcript_43062:267-1694(-)
MKQAHPPMPHSILRPPLKKLGDLRPPVAELALRGDNFLVLLLAPSILANRRVQFVDETVPALLGQPVALHVAAHVRPVVLAVLLHKPHQLSVLLGRPRLPPPPILDPRPPIRLLRSHRGHDKLKILLRQSRCDALRTRLQIHVPPVANDALCAAVEELGNLGKTVAQLLLRCHHLPVLLVCPCILIPLRVHLVKIPVAALLRGTTGAHLGDLGPAFLSELVDHVQQDLVLCLGPLPAVVDAGCPWGDRFRLHGGLLQKQEVFRLELREDRLSPWLQHRVPPPVERALAPALHQAGDLRPAVAKAALRCHDTLVLLLSPPALAKRWVDLVDISVATLQAAPSLEVGRDLGPVAEAVLVNEPHKLLVLDLGPLALFRELHRLDRHHLLEELVVVWEHLLEHLLCLLRQHSVPPHLDRNLGAALEKLGDLDPRVAESGLRDDDPLVLLLCPRLLADRGVELAEVPIAALARRPALKEL